MVADCCRDSEATGAGVRHSQEMSSLLDEIRQMASTAPSLRSLQEGLTVAIAERLSYYNWIGFYMLDPDDPETLVLGPFVGAPTPHVRIPVTRGICGAAVASGETVIIDDVGSDPRYLSCSIVTKSEIVVPIYASGHVVGEIDVDSHDPAAFTDTDQVFLEAVALIVGTFIEHGVRKSQTAQTKSLSNP
jgi:L-methionine (R)-S-oxide reductase